MATRVFRITPIAMAEGRLCPVRMYVPEDGSQPIIYYEDEPLRATGLNLKNYPTAWKYLDACLRAGRTVTEITDQ